MADEPMTLQQAADALGVHYMTVYRYVRTGRLPATRRGGTWQVAPSDLTQVSRTPPGDPRPTSSKRPAAPSRLEMRLLAGDEAGAWSLLESDLASSRTPSDLLLDVVGPALRTIGTRWERGDLTVADEHLATAVASRLVSRIGARFLRRGPKRGVVILAAPPGELHATPVAMAADLLRWRGFDVVELGADTPADALGQIGANTSDLLAVGMACTTPAACAPAKRAIAVLRRSQPDVPVLIGGRAIADAGHAGRLGADAFTGHRGDQLVEVVESVWAGVSVTR